MVVRHGWGQRVFQPPPSHLMGEGGFLPQGHGDGQVHNTRLWKDMTHSTLLITYTHGPGEQHNACHARPHGHRTPEKSEKPGAEGVGPCSIKKARCPPGPVRGYDWLI